jgi:hypothetical protein
VGSGRPRRAACDDAGDAFLTILTNGKVTEDGVEAHNDLLAEFPYLGPPRSVPSPRRNSCVTDVELAVDNERKAKNTNDAIPPQRGRVSAE